MTEAKTLKERLLEIIEDVSEGWMENICQPGGPEALADALITAGVQIMPWNDVKKGKPEIGDSYIVTIRQKYPEEKEWETHVDVASNYGTYIDNEWDTFNDWDEGQETHVTHWMEMPEPPDFKMAKEAVKE